MKTKPFDRAIKILKGAIEVDKRNGIDSSELQVAVYMLGNSKAIITRDEPSRMIKLFSLFKGGKYAAQRNYFQKRL